MDTYKHRYLDLKSKWMEYYDLQQEQKSLRRQILLGACTLFLLNRFMSGIFLAYPKEQVLLNVEVPESEPETKAEMISL